MGLQSQLNKINHRALTLSSGVSVFLCSQSWFRLGFSSLLSLVHVSTTLVIFVAAGLFLTSVQLLPLAHHSYTRDWITATPKNALLKAYLFFSAFFSPTKWSHEYPPAGVRNFLAVVMLQRMHKTGYILLLHVTAHDIAEAVSDRNLIKGSSVCLHFVVFQSAS